MFLLLTKTTMFVMHIWLPFISILVHMILIALYSYSAYAQASHDLSDPSHPQTGAPWYITKSCSVSSTSEIKGYCEQAKAAFALTIVMMCVHPTPLWHVLLTNNPACCLPSTLPGPSTQTSLEGSHRRATMTMTRRTIICRACTIRRRLLQRTTRRKVADSGRWTIWFPRHMAITVTRHSPRGHRLSTRSGECTATAATCPCGNLESGQ